MSKTLPRKKVAGGEVVILDLGCGDQKQDPNAIGIDVKEEAQAADQVVDIESDGIPYEPDSVDEIHTRMFAEHVDAFDLLVDCHRVLKPGGKVHITVPHPFTSGFWQDWTHTIQPGLTVDGFSYLERDHDMHYEHDMPPWTVEDLDVKFWLNLTSIPGRGVSATVSKVARMFTARTREELLKLPFAGGWIEATLVKPEGGSPQ